MKIGYRFYFTDIEPFVFQVNHASVVFPGYNHEVLVMCSGGVSGITRLLSGKLADSPYIKAIWIEQMAFVVLGLASSAIPFVQHYSVLVAISCIMGIADGCFMAMISVITHDLLGPEELAQGIGAYLSVIAIPFTAGPPVAGKFYFINKILLSRAHIKPNSEKMHFNKQPMCFRICYQYIFNCKQHNTTCCKD